jgi:hypothetical protein
MSEADCREINERGSLRGRPVDPGAVTIWDERRAVWDGLRVFTGRKPDVIGWFRSGQEGLEGRGGFRDTVYMRSFQYDILCSELLRTGDLDVIRAVLWNAYPTGRYAAPDWASLVGDRRLGPAERIIAWRRSRAPAGSPVRRGDVKEFWELFGEALSPDVILRLETEYTGFAWEVIERAPDAAVGRDGLDRLLLPLLRREYLGVKQGGLVKRALQALSRLHGQDQSNLAGEILDRLAAWDAMGDERSAVMWSGLRRPGLLDAATSSRIAALAREARVPRNAAEAFHLYPPTPKGLREVVRAEGGWQRHFEEYVEAAFGKPDAETAVEFLRALAGRRDPGPGRFVPSSMCQRLREGNVVLLVDEERKRLLERAWAPIPEALEYVRLREEATPGDGPVDATGNEGEAVTE